MFFESGEFAVGFSVVCIGSYEFLKIKFAEGAAYTWTKYIPMYNTEYSRYITMKIMYPFSDFYLSIMQYSVYIVVLYTATRWCMENTRDRSNKKGGQKYVWSIYWRYYWIKIRI